MTAQSSGRISHARRWADAHVWYLRRADDAYTGKDGKCTEKKEPCFVATQNGALAVRMVPLVREGVGDVAHDRNLSR